MKNENILITTVSTIEENFFLNYFSLERLVIFTPANASEKGNILQNWLPMYCSRIKFIFDFHPRLKP